MLDITGIFQNKALIPKQALEFGFVEENETYIRTSKILNGQFYLTIRLRNSGLPDARVFDAESGEEYVLIHLAEAAGAFVGMVAEACERELQEVAAHCFETRVFQSRQAQEIIAYAQTRYGDSPEFLWKKFPNNAIFRRADTGKWYGAILTTSHAKLGLAGDGTAEILDLRAAPEDVARLTAGGKYLPGYHMNKKHWITVCLDGRISMGEICARMEKSYILAK